MRFRDVYQSTISLLFFLPLFVLFLTPSGTQAQESSAVSYNLGETTIIQD